MKRSIALGAIAVSTTLGAANHKDAVKDNHWQYGPTQQQMMEAEARRAFENTQRAQAMMRQARSGK